MTYVIKQDLEPVGKWLADSIVKRSRRGISAEGSKFKPKKDGSASNVTDTGKLLNSIDDKITEDLVIVIETDVDYAPYVQRDRPFMGLTPNQERGLSVQLKKALDKAARRYNSENK